jgi:hypothetical protein
LLRAEVNLPPVANLCSTSKIFEKLILKQINYLESINKLDFTGNNQHGFKCNKSTVTAGAPPPSFNQSFPVLPMKRIMC